MTGDIYENARVVSVNSPDDVIVIRNAYVHKIEIDEAEGVVVVRVRRAENATGAARLALERFSESVDRFRRLCDEIVDQSERE